MDNIVLNPDDMDGCVVQLDRVIVMGVTWFLLSSPKRQADCVPGFLEPGLHIITGILLHNIGKCFSFTLLVVMSILQWIISRAWGVPRGKRETLMRLRWKYTKRKGTRALTLPAITPKLVH